MTEAEWLACTDPEKMLTFAQGKASDRKLRLFGMACCRRLWHLLDDRHCKKLVEVGQQLGGCENLHTFPVDSCQKAIEMAERAADEPVPAEELHALSEAAFAFERPAQYYAACYDAPWGPYDSELMASGCAASAAYCASLRYVHPSGVVHQMAQAVAFLRTKEYRGAETGEDTAERGAHCDVLRDILGNPFRPVTLDSSWLTSTAVKVAEAAYAERHFPEGHLDTTRLAVLADALEEAGCVNEDILGHLRGPGPHLRGCWCVDLLLSKS